jgi:hypothetical protein
MFSGVKKMAGYLKGEKPEEKSKGPTKKGKPEDIESHEAGLRKLEEEARQNQLRRRKMKRG